MTACCLVKSLHRTGDGSGGHVHEAAGVVCVFTFFSPLFFGTCCKRWIVEPSLVY